MHDVFDPCVTEIALRVWGIAHPATATQVLDVDDERNSFTRRSKKAFTLVAFRVRVGRFLGASIVYRNGAPLAFPVVFLDFPFRLGKREDGKGGQVERRPGE